MTVAELGLKIDSSQAKTAAADLNRLKAAGKSAEDQFAKIERAAAMGGAANRQYAAAVAQAYNMQGRLSNSQIAAIRSYETLIGKTRLLSQGHGREAAQFVALRKAGTTANTRYGQTISMLSGTLFDLEQQNTKTDGSANKFANTLARRFVFGYAISQLKQMVGSIVAVNRELAKTGDVGRFTGLGSQGIQGFQSAAAQKGIDSGKFLDDMTSFASKVKEAKTGVGEMAALFRLNGQEVGSVEDTMLKVADLVANTAEEEGKFSILQQAGLSATTEWARFMEQGSDAIRSAASNATKLTDEQLKAARDLDDRFNKLWDNFVRSGKRAIVDVADWMGEIDAAASRALLNVAFDRSAALANLMQNHGTQMGGGRSTEFYDSIFGKGQGPGGPTKNTVGPNTQNPKDVIAALNFEQQRLSILGQIATVGQQVAAVENQIRLARLNGVTIYPQEAEALKNLARERALGIDQIRSQIDSMNVEAATFGMTVGQATAYSLVQTKINEQRRLGNELSPEEIANLQRYAEASGAAAQKLDNMREAAGYTSGFLKDLKSNLQNGQKGWEAFGNAAVNVLNKIADKLIDMAVNNLISNAFGGSSGGLGSLLGGLFGGSSGPTMVVGGAGSMAVPTFHQGGIAGQVSPSRNVHPAVFDGATRYHDGGMAGLKPGEIPAILKKGEPIFKSMDAARAALGGGMSVSIGGSTIIVQGDANENTLKEMRLELEQRDRELPGKIVKTVNESRSRNILE